MNNRSGAITMLLSLNCKMIHNVEETHAIDYSIRFDYLQSILAFVTHDDRIDEVIALKVIKLINYYFNSRLWP